jgi:hypothetical protein
MSKEEIRVQMLSMIADWQQSGLSKKRYCEENGISTATFYYWFSRSKEKDAGGRRFIRIYKPDKKVKLKLSIPMV